MSEMYCEEIILLKVVFTQATMECSIALEQVC